MSLHVLDERLPLPHGVRCGLFRLAVCLLNSVSRSDRMDDAGLSQALPRQPQNQRIQLHAVRLCMLKPSARTEVPPRRISTEMRLGAGAGGTSYGLGSCTNAGAATASSCALLSTHSPASHTHRHSMLALRPFARATAAVETPLARKLDDSRLELG